MHDPRSRWAVPATRVARIVSARDWADDWIADPALDVLARIGPRPPEGDEAHRVIVLRGARDAEVAVIAAGAIHIGDVDATNVLPLPAVFTTSVPEISAIVVAKDESLSLLLDPLAITTPDAAFVRNHA
ncbi:MAG TPA: chemotaxis protein CheW [Kofleriaceae bacterium]|nr:chemotaxis protein CheW [Kofleriaceae bacterium]